MSRADLMEVEAFNYWRSMRKLNAEYRRPFILPDDIEDIKAELEAMALHTDWPLLRKRCVSAIEEPAAVEDVA